MAASWTYFWKWKQDNSKLIELAARFSRQAKAAGMERYGINAIRERLRWHVRVGQRRVFKFPNSLAPYLSRYLMDKNPDLRGFFVLRSSAADARRRRAKGK